MKQKKYRATILVADVLEALKHAEDAIDELGRWLAALRDDYQVPVLLHEIKQLVRQKKVRVVSTSWLQPRYRIGYARAARIMDLLR